MIFLYILALLVCFVFLARIVDLFFISSLDKISADLRLSHDAAGATLMAVGSSAPELFVALFSVFKPGNHQMIGIGSIVGSAIFNLLVIVGASALIRTAKLTWQPVIRDLSFYTVSVGLLVWFIFDGHFTLVEAGAFLAIYVLYVIAVVYWKKLFPYPEREYTEAPKMDKEKNRALKGFDKVLQTVFPKEKYYYRAFFFSIFLIAGLSWALVELAVVISVALNIPEAIIALTVLAIGTSIPDLFSSMIVAKQGRGEMAVSNAIGSNIFDILVGLGLPMLIFMFIHGSSIDAGGSNLTGSAIILFASVILLFLLLIFSKWKIGKPGGFILVGLYIFYVVREIILM
ncbi:MAG TPA: calcium/sodium antiporter [Prolixibacteraceae bacterium]|nr:calcium/sodium antiporter [Prolixibacteraceae bacterium]